MPSMVAQRVIVGFLLIVLVANGEFTSEVLTPKVEQNSREMGMKMEFPALEILQLDSMVAQRVIVGFLLIVLVANGEFTSEVLTPKVEQNSREMGMKMEFPALEILQLDSMVAQRVIVGFLLIVLVANGEFTSEVLTPKVEQNSREMGMKMEFPALEILQLDS
ncbi:hypothetical protein AOLI_G00152580 [Acnodon oligacanthus]